MLYAMLFSAVYAENGPKKHITERNPLIKRLVNLEANGGYPTSRTPGSRRSLVSRRRLAAAEARKALRAGQRRRLNPAEKPEGYDSGNWDDLTSEEQNVIAKSIIKEENGENVEKVEEIKKANKIEDTDTRDYESDTDDSSMSDHPIGDDLAYKRMRNQSNSTRRADFDVNLNALESMFFMVSKEVTTGAGTEWKPLGDHHAIDVDGQVRYIRTYIRNKKLTRAEMTKHLDEEKPIKCTINGDNYMVTRIIQAETWENRYSDSFINLAISVWKKLRIIREDFSKIQKDTDFTDVDMEGTYTDKLDFENRRQIYERCVDLLRLEREEMGKCFQNWTELQKQIDFQTGAPVELEGDKRGKLLDPIEGSGDRKWNVQLDDGSEEKVLEAKIKVLTKEMPTNLKEQIKIIRDEMKAKKDEVDKDNDLAIKEMEDAEDLVEAVETMRRLVTIMQQQKN